MNLAFTDTETTGTEEDDRLLQLAYKCGTKEINELYNPGKKINLVAMATHHITEEMVADKPTFVGSDEHRFLKKWAKKRMVMVAHNAKFDAEMLKREGIEYHAQICTLKVVRYLDVDAKLECHKLQYLRYLYNMKIDAVAHDAWGDILVLEQLFWRLVKKLKKDNGYGDAEAIAEMLEISTKPSLIRKIGFGKYRDEMLEDIAEKDPGYLQWLLGEKEKDNDPGDEDMIYSLRHYLDIPF